MSRLIGTYVKEERYRKKDREEELQQQERIHKGSDSTESEEE